MPCNNINSNINKTIILEPLDAGPILSACTGVYTNFISGCNSNANIDIGNNTISGFTYYGDGSNLYGISTDNFYTTGSTLINKTLYFDRIDSLSAYSINLSGLTSSYSGGTASGTTVNTTNFDNNLSGDDDTVQKALNTLDKLVGEAPEDGKTYGRKNASWNALAAVAVSANYSDLSGTPDLGVYVEKDLSSYTSEDYNTIDDRDDFYIDHYQHKPRRIKWEAIKRHLLNYFNNFYAKISNLAAVAFSGSYTDLSDEPDLSIYEKISNKRTSFQDTPDDTHYISEKLAKDTFDGKEDILGYTPEDVTNKKTDLSDNSDDYYASQKAVKTAVDEKQDNYTAESITIAVGDWSGLTAIKTVLGVTETNLILLGFNKANGDLLGDYNVKMDSQDTNELTFKADETPEEDINLTIVIFD